jgi:peroxiredoxin/ribosomal protein S18 acetylase RimI-like enzyme
LGRFSTNAGFDLPPDLPVPLDDGAASHLLGERIPSVAVRCGDRTLDLRDAFAGRTVVFFYPRTGVPGQAPPLGFAGGTWESIPGARGCTPQACGFRDLHALFEGLGVSVRGLSTNTPEHQAEFIARTGAPYPLLSDADLRVTRAMNLPTFDFPVESGGPTTLLRRMAWYVEDGVIQKVWYPVFPPDRNAADVLAWLEQRGHLRTRPTGPGDAAFVRAELLKHWGSTVIRSRGVPFDADRLEGFIAEVGGRPVGAITLAFSTSATGPECEIITLSTCDEDRGAGTALLVRAFDEARARRCRRAFLTTSNDNLRALAFYQRRRMRICAVFPGMIDRYRETQPGIPLVAANGVPIRDEIELELVLA